MPDVYATRLIFEKVYRTEVTDDRYGTDLRVMPSYATDLEQK